MSNTTPPKPAPDGSPGTPAGSPGTPSKPPATPPTFSPSKVLNCTSDPDKFAIVKIHTAKCAKCDQRNRSTMRRCPGCTYQICEPCFDKFGGAPLAHGQMARSPSNLPPTPARRILFTPGGSGGIAPSPMNLGAMASPSAAAGNAMTPTSGAAKKGSPLKPKAKAAEDLSDEEYNPEPASPTPVKKRKAAAVVSPTNLQTTEKRRSTRSLAAGVATQSSNASPLTTGLDPKHGNGGALYVPEREVTLTTRHMIDEELKRLGGTGYSEGNHLYGPLPPWDKVKLAKMQHDTAERGKAQAKAEAEVGPVGKQAGDGAATDGYETVGASHDMGSTKLPPSTKKQTVRDLVKLEAQKYAEFADITEEQMGDMVSAMTSVCRTLIVQFYKEASARVKEFMRFSMDMPFEDLSDPQKEQILTTIGNEAKKQLDQFEDEAAMNSMPAGTPMKVPEKGLFHVTPSPAKKLSTKDSSKVSQFSGKGVPGKSSGGKDKDDVF